MIGLAAGNQPIVEPDFVVRTRVRRQILADATRDGGYPPLLAAWGPFVLFLLLGETVLIRTEE